MSEQRFPRGTPPDLSAAELEELRCPGCTERDRIRKELAAERSLWCDKPDDRLYHAADGTWWMRGPDGSIQAADEPPIIAEAKKAAFEEAAEIAHKTGEAVIKKCNHSRKNEYDECDFYAARSQGCFDVQLAILSAITVPTEALHD